jgi:hypothetical protein
MDNVVTAWKKSNLNYTTTIGIWHCFAGLAPGKSISDGIDAMNEIKVLSS